MLLLWRGGKQQPEWEILSVLWLTPQMHHFHPCWPKGYSTQVLLRDVYRSPCTTDLRPHVFNSSALISLSGTSSPALCRDLVSGLFNFSSCPFSRCSFNGVFQPPVTGNFIVSLGRWVWGQGSSSIWGLVVDCTTLPPTGFFCILLHRGLPQDGDGAASGHPEAAGGSRGDRL